MKCSRCGGLLVPVEEEDPPEKIILWRCVNCGELVDATVLMNRRSKDDR
jgi:DNA-directed RNA polymerase subunit M/transcription elongation factor TFIIS